VTSSPEVQIQKLTPGQHSPASQIEKRVDLHWRQARRRHTDNHRLTHHKRTQKKADTEKESTYAKGKGIR